MKIIVDKTIYSDTAISMCVYALSGKYQISRSADGQNEIIVIESLDSILDEKAVQIEFWQSLNDYKLRDLISKETHEIRTILYAKAFAESEEITEEEILS